MARIFDCSDAPELLAGMRHARGAIGRGGLVVLPTDTVYGIAADAFDGAAVQKLLDAKGRGRQSPPPVLVPGLPTLEALAETIPDTVRDLVAVFWPGALTVIVQARRSLAWDLGDTNGTVALRMPAQALALELLAETGPLAVSSANLTGDPAATTASGAHAQLGDSVDVYLDGGPTPGPVPSTIIDASRPGEPLRIVRLGLIDEDAIRGIVGDALPAADG